MVISPDEQVFWQHGFFKLNATIVTTWAIIAVLAIGARLITRRLTTDIRISRWQSVLEIIVLAIREQISDVGISKPDKFIPFLGSIFLLTAFASLCTVIPGYIPPTSSLSTTAALALCVFFAVPVFGISEAGIIGYFKTYFQPTFIMLPFNVISELSRTLALAIRMFGNMMSGAMIVSILLTIAPFFFPVVMSILGLLTGMVQAYIFSILATVFIAAAIREGKKEKPLDNVKTVQNG